MRLGLATVYPKGQMSNTEEKETVAPENEEEDGEIEEVPCHSFWSAIVKTEEPYKVEIPQYSNLQITGVCIDELPSGEPKPVRLVAEVKSLDFLSEKEAATKENSCLIASLIPGEKEFQPVSVLFTQFDDVTLINKGTVPIHVTGTLHPDDDSEFEYDEEEEGEENCDCGHCEDHKEKKEE